MPTATVIPATPANTKFLNLWNGASNDTPPTDWWREDYDDSAWETPGAVTPDTGDPRYASVSGYGLTPMWGASDSAGTRAIILVRTHFTLPDEVTDGFGIPLTSADIFTEAMQVSNGGYEPSGHILEGSGTQFDLTWTLVEYYNGTSSPFYQPPSGPCVTYRNVSNLHLGADNVFAAVINLGIVNCNATIPYGPWNPAIRTSHTSWFVLGFRFFTESCSEYGRTTDDITADMVKVLRFSGTPPANWQTVGFDDSAWDNAVPSSTWSDLFSGWNNRYEGGTGFGHHINGDNIFYEPIATFSTVGNPLYEEPLALWAVPEETTAGVSVIMRIHYSAPSVDSIIRRSQVERAGSTSIYDGTLVARDFAGFASISSYVNGFGGGHGIELSNFPQLITPGQENIIALLMTTTSTGLSAGFGAWVQLGVQLTNCGPAVDDAVPIVVTTRGHSWVQVID